MIDLFRVAMTPEAGKAVAKLYTPDENGRVYCGQGKYTDDFEILFALETGLKNRPLGVNSCSAAIDLALHMIGIGHGDEVITTPITCTATNGPIISRGAKIVWADVDSVTGLIDPWSVARSITPRTKAVIAVDWAGRHCDYAALRNAIYGRVPNISIIQDAAHCLYLGDQGHGDYVAWSFGPIKHLTTGGYGGALMVRFSERKRAELLRWHGLDRNGPSDSFRCEQDITEVGYRYHMTDDQAVVGLANLTAARLGVDRARDNAAFYSDAFKDCPGVIAEPWDQNCDYWLFGLLLERNRDGFMERMKERGIATSRVHARNDKHTAFQVSSTTGGSMVGWPLSGVEYFDGHQVNIPVGWWVTEEQREYIAKSVRECATEALAAR